ncbi:hypothetical protein SDC9_175105 [bioreactor metagenome]|uniref:Uncharacterized protein n=1 Tax=bioreactor metagenome TaxID=1076179 RepID=A0A645GL44_9ZZZZ
MVLENGEVEATFDAGLGGSGSKVFVVLCEFVADGEPLLVFAQLPEGGVVRQFLAAGLDGKVSLAVGNDRLRGVAVLDDQVAGIAGEADVFDLPFCPRADVDHCEDILKMVGRSLATLFTGYPGAFDGGKKVSVLRIIQCCC